jgi:hypothetical protein
VIRTGGEEGRGEAHLVVAEAGGDGDGDGSRETATDRGKWRAMDRGRRRWIDDGGRQEMRAVGDLGEARGDGESTTAAGDLGEAATAAG